MDSVRTRSKQRAAGRKWFEGLSFSDKDRLGDEFVFGTFDWREWDNWFSSPPSRHFLAGAEEARIHWEIDLSCPQV